MFKILYTANLQKLEEIQGDYEIYIIMKNHHNDEVVPNEYFINHLKSGKITWKGFCLNYGNQLRSHAAHDWMKRVSEQAVYKDVVLADETIDVNYSYRKLLADRMKNLYSGIINLKYQGELVK